MKYVRLGSSGLKVSKLCLGTMGYGSSGWRSWVLDESECRHFYMEALEAGINFFDTANMYSLGMSEEITGRALRSFARRDEVIIATKVYMPMNNDPNGRGLSRKHILEAAEASLGRLETDYIDLYQIHRWDTETPIEETLRALDDLIRSGKVRYIGASSMYAWQLCKALFTSELQGWSRFVSMQCQYNAVYREEERETIPLCIDQGLAVIPWSPLARGFLARPESDEERTERARSDAFARQWYGGDGDGQIRARVLEIAERRGVSPAQVALAWVLHQPGVTCPIAGVTKEGQLKDALAAAELELEPEELEAISEPYRPKPVMGKLSEPAPRTGTTP
jgi:aryl-alcohol dehydrogenase (NADP+)